MMCAVITRFHWMLGCDFHTAQPTFPVPPPLPFTRHVVFAIARVGPWWMAHPQESPTIDTGIGHPLAKTFDIGMLIPHIGPNHPLLLALLTLMSSSQGHFGLSRVTIKTNSGDGPVAVALGLVINPQLNCNDALPAPKVVPFSLPLPTGILFTPNNVVGGLTLGDFIAGILSMALTMIVTAAINVGTFLLSKGIAKLVSEAITETVIRLPKDQFVWCFEQQARLTLLARDYPRIAAMIPKVKDMLVGWAIGSPSGYVFTTDPQAPVRAPFDDLLGRVLDTPFRTPSATMSRVQGAVDHTLTPPPGEMHGLSEYFDNPAIPTVPVYA
jgi:hypothetical protein